MTAGSVVAGTIPTASDRLRRWGRLGTTFMVGQATMQGLNILSGFLLLRWLSVEYYAQIGFTLAFQSMLATVLDLGAGGAVTALVGSRIGQPAVVGSYLAAARQLRARLALAVIPVGTIVFLVVGARQPWSLAALGLLAGSAVATAWWQASAGIDSAPLLMHRRLNRWYGIGAAAAAGRLALLSALQFAGSLTGAVAAWVSALATGLTARLYRRAAAPLQVEPVHAEASARRELRRYLAPQLPGIVFNAFQGQITLLLVSWFGQTRNIAEVAALGRVGQVFLLFAAFNQVVLTPHLAALPADRVFRRYAEILGAALALGAGLCAVGWWWPGPILWLMGGNYGHLGPELRPLLAASALNYVASVMWTVHAARKWIYWWSSALYLGGTLAVQAAFLATHDLSTTAAAMQLAVWTAVAALAVHALTALRAWRLAAVHPAA